MPRNYTALVLQGGGALGAYEYGVLKALYQQKNFNPDIIAGVSIGAFSAAVLTGGKHEKPTESLGQLWELFTAEDIPWLSQAWQLMMSLSFNAGMYNLNPYAYVAPTLVTHFYNTDRLYKSLSEVIDLDKLNDKKSPHLIITATNVETGEIERFDNRKMRITLDHIVASGSLPPSFPMTQIADQHYWDGGLFSNTPLTPAFKQLEKLGGEDSEREIIWIELFPHKGPLPVDMTDVLARMQAITFESKISHDAGLYQTMNAYHELIKAIDHELPQDSELRKTPAYQALIDYKKIHKVSVIKNTSPPNLYSSADFTQQTIDRRIEHGFKDGQAFVKRSN